MTVETAAQRARRERNRALFDSVAALYDATRQRYPREVVQAMVETAELSAGCRVLEVGCGTGQLTGQLAGRGMSVTALDIGSEMLALARANVPDPDVGFERVAFEAYESSRRFDLVVSATAFHWIDPAVAWTKTAALLRPGGWLALLTTRERHHEPVRAALSGLWRKHQPGSEEWIASPPWSESLRAAGVFGEIAVIHHERPLQVSVESAIDVECTRATFLSWTPATQEAFRRDLSDVLRGATVVEVVQETDLTMAQRA